MGKSDIPEIMLSCGAVQFSANDTIPVVVSFSVLGGIRDAFNEENWTKAYDKNDNTFKMKYGIKIHSGGIKKRVHVGQVGYTFFLSFIGFFGFLQHVFLFLQSVSLFHISF